MHGDVTYRVGQEDCVAADVLDLVTYKLKERRVLGKDGPPWEQCAEADARG